MSAPAEEELRWLPQLRANATRALERENPQDRQLDKTPERSKEKPASPSASVSTSASRSGWAIDFRGDRLTHGELVASVEQALSTISDLGLRRGEIVAILASPSLAGICLLHAFLEAGVVMLPLNARLSEAELIDALTSTRVKALWVEAASGERDPAEMTRRNERVAAAAKCELIEFAPALDSGRVRVEREVMGEVEVKIAVKVKIEVKGEVDRAEASGADSQSEEDRRAVLAAQGAALILRTSGTTGRPKGAVLSLGNLIASAVASQTLLETTERDRWLLCMPIFHIGGLSILVRSVLDGSSVVVHPKFEATRVAEALSAEGVTCVSLVATMLHRLIETRGDQPAPASLRLLLLGGGPASQALLERADALGYPVAPTYGLTEAASQVATRPPNKNSPDPGDLAAGLEALPGVELRIMQGTLSESSVRGGAEGAVEGEIEVRGPNVMLGYLDAPEETAEVLREGWLATGDFGRLDAEGRLRVLDRRSDLILSGGENIYPAEIESVLAECAEVEEAAVVGVLDAEYGARPIAYVVLRAGASGDVSALRRHCEARLARFKVPVEFHFRDALPRTASGKLMRRALHEADTPS